LVSTKNKVCLFVFWLRLNYFRFFWPHTSFFEGFFFSPLPFDEFSLGPCYNNVAFVILAFIFTSKAALGRRGVQLQMEMEKCLDFLLFSLGGRVTVAVAAAAVPDVAVAVVVPSPCLHALDS